MQSDTPLGSSVEFDVFKVKGGSTVSTTAHVATEVPLTMVVNDTEVATVMCTPENLKELCYGFLFTAGIIKGKDSITSYSCDDTEWLVRVAVKDTLDLPMLTKRLFTSGCGRGVMYSSVLEITSRHPLTTSFTVEGDALVDVMRWLQKSSDLFKNSGGVHTAALSHQGRMPETAIDDIGRHNAVDKVIGDALIRGVDLSQCVLACSGRTSSDILHKAKRSDIPVSVSRGAPTHQTVLHAREMGVTIVGLARGESFTVYTHPERIAGLG